MILDDGEKSVGKGVVKSVGKGLGFFKEFPERGSSSRKDTVEISLHR